MAGRRCTMRKLSRSIEAQAHYKYQHSIVLERARMTRLHARTRTHTQWLPNAGRATQSPIFPLLSLRQLDAELLPRVRPSSILFGSGKFPLFAQSCQLFPHSGETLPVHQACIPTAARRQQLAPNSNEHFSPGASDFVTESPL